MSDERPTHSPMFARSHDEDEPNAVGGFGLTDTTDRRTFAVKAARTLTADEVRRIGAEQVAKLRQALPDADSRG